MNKVDSLTVYDHDTGMLDKVTRRVGRSFEKMRLLIETERPPATGPGGEVETETNKETVLRDKVRESKADFEQILGIPVTKAEYRTLEKGEFPAKIAGLINRILAEILTAYLQGKGQKQQNY